MIDVWKAVTYMAFVCVYMHIYGECYLSMAGKYFDDCTDIFYLPIWLILVVRSIP